MDQLFAQVRRNAERSLKVWTHLRGRFYGYNEWSAAYDRPSKAAR